MKATNLFRFATLTLGTALLIYYKEQLKYGNPDHQVLNLVGAGFTIYFMIYTIFEKK